MSTRRQRSRSDREGGPRGCVPVAAQRLLAELVRQPWGQVSPSEYETARLVALAPWLPGNAARVDWLLARQRADGGWGPPGGYGVVPTLSATDALLATALAGEDGRRPHPSAEPARAADAGLRALAAAAGSDVPDTPAVDLIAPALADRIGRRLARLAQWPGAGLDAWRDAAPPPLPAGLSGKRWAGLRGLVAAGRPLPEKLLHALEVLGPDAPRAAGVRPCGPGAVGASPAATAAWLGAPGRGDPAATATWLDGPGGGDPAATAAWPARSGQDRSARDYLATVRRQHAELAPCATPITVFERAWVLSDLLRAGVPVTVPSVLTRSLAAALGPDGAATGPGLPADADTTAVVLHALTLLGRPAPPAALLGYDRGDHFSTWSAEDGASVTTNAHVLDALGRAADHRYASAARRVAVWLVDRQQPDGRWTDRWHASPYYATGCAAVALAEYAAPAESGPAVDRAVEWVLASAREDGGWGGAGSTSEETAYAVRILLTGPPGRTGVRAALRRGVKFLISHPDGARQGPSLWHDKDLYRPTAVVRAAVLSSIHRGLLALRDATLPAVPPAGADVIRTG
ncbi:prenyltransferase/squalene oxidase repeat-containing protein [Plantactinospora siamensis]|uniref:Prenyltransferase/squalene oxidase repeat-containing protein n=1 Tax=Plantactinospora siamensis TaxID=555372 RepID=A0ABV6P141_9ACTN